MCIGLIIFYQSLDLALLSQLLISLSSESDSSDANESAEDHDSAHISRLASRPNTIDVAVVYGMMIIL